MIANSLIMNILPSRPSDIYIEKKDMENAKATLKKSFN